MSNKYFPSSSPDEMLPPKMSPDQESALDMHFNRNKSMHPSDVAILSAETGLTEEQVQVCQTSSLFFIFFLNLFVVFIFFTRKKIPCLFPDLNVNVLPFFSFVLKLFFFRLFPFSSSLITDYGACTWVQTNNIPALAGNWFPSSALTTQ